MDNIKQPLVHSHLPKVLSAGDAAMAYLLQYADAAAVAFPAHVSKEFIDCPQYILRVPKAAGYAYGMIEWRKQWLPLIDLKTLLHPGQTLTDFSVIPPYCLILAYRNAYGRIAFAAVGLQKMPEIVYVRNEDFCQLPDTSHLWSSVAISCFSYKQEPVPILSTEKLFGQYHS